MRRLAAFLSLLTALCFALPAIAFWQSRDSNYNVAISSGGGGSCSASTAFLARTSGLSGTETTAVDTMICGMVTDGTFSLLDVLYIFATNNTTTACLNLISASFTCTSSGGLTFTADHGYTGDGTNALLSGFTPSTAAGNYAQNSASIGVYVQTSRTTAAPYAEIGTTNALGTAAVDLIPWYTGNLFFSEMNANSTSISTSTNVQGMWITSRTAASGAGAVSVRRNQTAFTSFATASVANPNQQFRVLSTGAGSGDAILFPTQDQLSSAFMGGGLTSGNSDLVASRINAYMTALGINTY